MTGEQPIRAPFLPPSADNQVFFPPVSIPLSLKGGGMVRESCSLSLPRNKAAAHDIYPFVDIPWGQTGSRPSITDERVSPVITVKRREKPRGGTSHLRPGQETSAIHMSSKEESVDIGSAARRVEDKSGTPRDMEER